MKNLTLTRPLAIIDLETTGLNPAECRIIELSVMFIAPEATPFQKTRRFNPGIPIELEAVKAHGITLDDVKDCPPFAAMAKAIHEALDNCDLAGFNLKRFDLKVLAAEFARCGTEFDLTGRSIIDACEIFHEREPRDLAAAVRFYLGRDHDQAHSAEGDVLATARIIEAMLERYDLPRASSQLAALFHDPNAVDLDERFIRRDGEIVFNFGKHLGKPIGTERGYLHWMLEQSFLPDTKRIAREALQPQPEGVR